MDLRTDDRLPPLGVDQFETDDEPHVLLADAPDHDSVPVDECGAGYAVITCPGRTR